VAVAVHPSISLLLSLLIRRKARGDRTTALRQIALSGGGSRLKIAKSPSGDDRRSAAGGGGGAAAAHLYLPCAILLPRARGTAEFHRLANVPPEAEWFANLSNAHTRRVYENAVKDFMRFTGIQRPEEFRTVIRAHIIAWRDDLVRRGLGGNTRHRLAALFEYLCNKNAVTHNPVKGVERPKTESGEGKARALGDHQARELLVAPAADTIKSKRDRAILSTLLFHALDHTAAKRGHWQLLCEADSATWRHRIVSRLSCQARGRGSSAIALVKSEKVVSITRLPRSGLVQNTLSRAL
jgi:hypothetical protein